MEAGVLGEAREVAPEGVCQRGDHAAAPSEARAGPPGPQEVYRDGQIRAA